jgi:hypothetical protein
MIRRYTFASLTLLSLALIACRTTHTPAAKSISPGSFCLGCCSGVGTGNLKILDDRHFEIEYLRYEGTKEYNVRGIGTYIQQNGLLTLQFTDLPTVTPEIRLRQIANANWLEIHVKKVIDPLGSDSAGVATLAVRNPTVKRPVLVRSVFPASGRDEFLVLKSSQYKNDWTMEASFMEKNKTSIPLPPPGIYEAEIVMPGDYADVHLGPTDTMNFRITQSAGHVMIRQEDNEKIFFTTRSCVRN